MWIVLSNYTPQGLTADAGYGSEENYEYLEEKQIEAYVTQVTQLQA